MLLQNNRHRTKKIDVIEIFVPNKSVTDEVNKRTVDINMDILLKNLYVL